MWSFAPLAIVCAILLHVALVSGLPGKKFGEMLCKNAKNMASHSKLLEGRGNRTTCVVAVTDKVLYTKTVATVKPLQETAFQVENLGTFELTLTSECELDPCYKVMKSPGGAFDGNFIYNTPGIVNNKLAFIVAFDCKDGKTFAQKGEFYDASPAIVNLAKNKFGFDITMKDLKDCVDKAK